MSGANGASGASPKVVLVVGGSIGGEIVAPVLDLLAQAGAEIDWVRVDVDASREPESGHVLDEAVDAIRTHKIALKTKLLGQIDAAPQPGSPGGPRNPNVLLRMRLDLFAGVRFIKPLPGLATRYPELDLLLVRENTEDIYKGIEHVIVPGVVQSLKVVTRRACERIARYAFNLTQRLGRRQITFIQ